MTRGLTRRLVHPRNYLVENPRLTAKVSIALVEDSLQQMNIELDNRGRFETRVADGHLTIFFHI